MSDRRLNVNEVATAYGVKPRTIWLWNEKGLIPRPIVERKNYTRWLESEIIADIRKAERAEQVELAS